MNEWTICKFPTLTHIDTTPIARGLTTPILLYDEYHPFRMITIKNRKMVYILDEYACKVINKNHKAIACWPIDKCIKRLPKRLNMENRLKFEKFIFENLL